MARSELVSDPRVRNEDIITAVKPLVAAARRFGMPKDGAQISYVYSEFEKTDGEKKLNMPDDERYFRVLGLLPTSNIGLITAAYRELAKQYHPDVAGGISEERMKEINEAYEHVISKLRNKNNTR
ncbi:hypothetical protein DMB44_08900 [Thermoplasma sp. Kam2015]|nr:hypothetical protein DMB44_08900 [Thermoplasma sp. Kam2015]